jgi:hypothetical protein
MMGGRRPELHQHAKTVVVETSSEGKPPIGKPITELLPNTRVGLDLAKSDASEGLYERPDRRNQADLEGVDLRIHWRRKAFARLLGRQ